MEDMPLFIICTMIVLLVSTVTSIITLVSLLRKPVDKYKEKQENELKETITSVLVEILPGLLKSHDLEIRERYKSDRERYLQEIKTEVLTDTQDKLDKIEILQLQYDALIISTKDVLREKIIKIYNDNKNIKKLPILDKERLDQFYKDYKALKGNSYIDKYYNRMCKWQTIYDDEDKDNEIM